MTTTSPRRSQDGAADAISNLRLSMDEVHPPANGVNGYSDSVAEDEQPNSAQGSLNDVERLQQELERTRAEKDSLDDQYRGLLGKLTTMRNTLGNKLKEDAEELDRREQLLQQYIAQNEELSQTVVTLRDELVLVNQESQKLSEELTSMRGRVAEESAIEASIRERQIHDLQQELEMCRTEKDDWERAAQQESVAADELRTMLAAARRDLEMEEAKRERDQHDLEMEKEKTANLQSVLEDFQSAKEAEVKQALLDYDLQIRQTTQSLAEYKSRALSAEAELSEAGSSSRRVEELEKELKEKNSVIGKLRHDSVITHEHLSEALRRLRKSASDENVDRRLVTNILLSFLTTSRGDSKRFEMLNLLASILSWSDAERETAGLQRISAAPKATRKASVTGTRAPEPVKVEESESFSNMWVEFLLKEAAQGVAETSSPTTARTPGTLGSPTSGFWSPSALKSPGMRLPSISSRSESGAQTPQGPATPPLPRRGL